MDHSCALTLVASCFPLSKTGSPSSATGHPDNQVLPPLTSGLSASFSPPATRSPCVDQLRRLLPWSRLGMGVSCSWNGFFPSICLAHSYNPFKSCVNGTLSMKLTSMLLLNLCLSLLSCYFRFPRNVLTLYVTYLGFCLLEYKFQKGREFFTPFEECLACGKCSLTLC